MRDKSKNIIYWKVDNTEINSSDKPYFEFHTVEE
jgi:hypothetical protein